MQTEQIQGERAQRQAPPYVCLYTGYAQTLAPYSDAERGRLFMALLEYAETGAEPDFTGNERFLWPTLKTQYDRDAEAYARRCGKNRANGAKGGRPEKERKDADCVENERKDTESVEKERENAEPVENERENAEPVEKERKSADCVEKNTEKTERFFAKPKKPNKNENEKKNENENENEKKNENERKNTGEGDADAAAKPPPRPRFFPPDEKTVAAYCASQGYTGLDSARFVDYYTANGWRIGSNPMVDWKAAVRAWHRKDQKHGTDIRLEQAERYGVLCQVL